ncbi:MAG: hypothetical protein WAW85_10240 [Gordonia sp. (in: high G+C Gram-positive bacteria)]|uniref:hypothetical protein n=1 Tax=Gordonia sp. (in: high G+C Gram-positive bacteria) TaxID=84139 RepID=UPI003BB79BA7
MKKTGKWLTFSGLALGILAVIVGVVLLVLGLQKLADVERDAVAINRAGEVAGEFTRDYPARAGDVVVIYANNRPAALAASCEVRGGPAPAEPGPAQMDNFEITFNGSTVVPVTAFRFAQSGDYVLVCQGPGMVAGAPISTSAFMQAGFGGLLAVFGGMLGGLLFIVGVVLWIVGSNKEKNAATTRAYGGQPYGGQPYGGQPFSNQPFPGQPYPGQAYPGQPYPGQAYPGQAYPAPDQQQPPTYGQQNDGAQPDQPTTLNQPVPGEPYTVGQSAPGGLAPDTVVHPPIPDAAGSEWSAAPDPIPDAAAPDSAGSSVDSPGAPNPGTDDLGLGTSKP